MPIAAPATTLTAIKQKVRRLTRTPSEEQLSDTELNDYINTFVLYDMPNNLRLFSFRTLLTFYTQPNVDTYDTVTAPPNDPLYNFKNKYIAIHQPIYLAGVQGYFTQHRDVFYGFWPQTNTVINTQQFGTGSSGGPFTGTLPYFILQNSLFFSALDNNGTSQILVDYPQDNVTGYLNPTNTTPTALSNAGTINYITGAYSVTFPSNVKIKTPVYAEMIVYQPGKPVAMLYYDDKFIIRPVPDKAYAIQIEVDAVPTQFFEDTESPQLEQFWQYIAYGAALKIFQDRLDTDSIEQIAPEFDRQERLCLRRTLTEQANSRTVTIYTQGTNRRFGWFGTGWPY